MCTLLTYPWPLEPVQEVAVDSPFLNHPPGDGEWDGEGFQGRDGCLGTDTS